MDIFDMYVKDVLKSSEYREISDRYEDKFGYFHPGLIPQDETLRGFSEKVAESLNTGYNTLPEAYDVKLAEIWLYTRRFKDINEKYRELTNEGIPLMQIGGISIDDLEKLVDDCVRQGRDLFPEYFEWDIDPDADY